MNSDAESEARHLAVWRPVMEGAGGVHVRDCTFLLNGTLYDLSAADPEKLPLIVERGLFVVENETCM
jgi:hypothetical protein